MASSCIRAGLDWILGKISLLKEWSGVGPGCPGQWGSPHPWRGSKNVWMRHFRTGFRRHGGVGLMVGLHDLGGLFQPLRFCDPLVLHGWLGDQHGSLAQRAGPPFVPSFVSVAVVELQWDAAPEICRQCSRATAAWAPVARFQPHHAFPTSHIWRLGDPLPVPTFLLSLFLFPVKYSLFRIKICPR